MGDPAGETVDQTAASVKSQGNTCTKGKKYGKYGRNFPKTAARAEKAKVTGIHREKAGACSLQESAETGGRAEGCPTRLVT